MTTELFRAVLSPFLILLLTWQISCSGRDGKGTAQDTPVSAGPAPKSNESILKMVSPGENTEFRLKEPVKIVMELKDDRKVPDSLVIIYDGKYIATLKSGPWTYTVAPEYTVTTGRKALKVTSFREGSQQNPITRFMVVYSDVPPKKNGFRVVKSYPHDVKAFTQGLVFDNGTLFESTGQETESSLREVDLLTGKVLRQLNLESSLFGEGITLWHDRIYHLTWTSKVGFVYEKSTFRLMNKFYYQTDGWGLTTINDRIVMSDGSNVLTTYEPEMFTAVSRLEVYDNEKKVDSLNELEYINGEIWANVWMTDLIARIDPASGKVIAYIDLTGLLPKQERTYETNVLNGIAWDQKGGRIFVTGKNWPKLYEITVTQ